MMDHRKYREFEQMPSQWSRGELQTLSCCPACGWAADSVVYFERGEDSLLMPDHWRIHRCSQCSSIYLNPRPDRASLPAAYVDYLTHEVTESEQAFSSNAVQWALVRDYLSWRFNFSSASKKALTGGRLLFRAFEPWRLKLDRFGRHLTRRRFPHAGRLLDIGCGAGDFLILAQAMGWSTVGCDPDDKVVAICRSRDLDVRHGGVEAFSEQSGSFDAITLNQVIEHVIEPQELLRQCLQLLRPKGVLWIGFPNPHAIGAKMFGPAWAGLHPPYHLCLPTQRVLRVWLQDAGFEKISFVRRGAHARASWHRSAEIAESLDMSAPPKAMAWFGRIIADTVSTLTPRWAEETVAIARKPQV